MKQTLFAIALFNIFCFGASALPADKVIWEPNIKMEKHLFPSYIIAGATKKFKDLGAQYLGESKGLVGIDISSGYNHASYRLDIKANEIADETSFEFTLPEHKKDAVFYVFPNINYRFRELRKMDQPMPVNFTFVLYVNGKEDGQQTETVNIQSINDCPYFIVNDDKSEVDMRWMYSAYVNENHPMIDQILHEALATGLVDRFTDYSMVSETNKTELFKQTLAIWTALYNRKIVYSNTVTPSLIPGSNIYCQRIRFFDQAINAGQANCVDGSAVFASMFRRIGLAPFLVLIPQHCFVGFYTNAEQQEVYCLETTVIGLTNITEDMVDAKTLSYLVKLYPPDIATKNKAAIIAFAYALKLGLSEYDEASPKLTSGAADYLLIDIDKARKDNGVIPLSD